MQDLHSIPGGAPPRFFPTGLSRADAASTTPCPTSFVDRRLRPSPHQNLKCPRCDSPNTKFCYYNNYNLSQPRHFCKSCRRYWTKGGVLRNVPVGGGCRKSSSKRSSNSVTSTASSKSSSKSVNSSTSSRSSGSCDNSSALTSTTITTTTTTTSTTTTAISTTPVDGPLPAAAELFPASTATDLVSTAGYSFPDLYSFHIPQPQQYEAQIRVVDGNDHVLTPTVEEITIPPPADHLGFMDQTVPADLPTLLDRGNERSDQLATIDWQGCLDATVGLFDSAVGATGVGDQGLHWSHGQWADVEPTTYFP